MSAFTTAEMSHHGAEPPEHGPRRASLCFVIDPDFGFLQAFAQQLRGVGLDSVELVSSARLAENVAAQDPEIIFLDLNPGSPHDCVRALMALKDCRFSGRVQLFGRCELGLLDNFRRIGADASLTMLPVLQKPIDFVSVRKIVLEQKLSCQEVAPQEVSLKTAIARDTIVFRYQPKVDLKRRQIVGAEAFARIAHPRHGILLPARFLAGAAEEDLIELARRALMNAIDFGMRLAKEGISLPIAINLSVDSIMKLPIAELMQRTGTQGDSPAIIFDVPEAQALNRITVLRDRFKELEKFRISLAIDNFGRGNSSFSLFRYLQLSEIKIDASFVQGCVSNAGNSNVCKSMIQLARNFSCKSVAVGVETGEDAQHLAALSCDVVQGHIFGRPMTDRQLMTMLEAGRAQCSDFVGPVAWVN
jgi:EAL domain-containing protein (putative c-di-GMP-specific phosphodiesterase class I)